MNLNNEKLTLKSDLVSLKFDFVRWNSLSLFKYRFRFSTCQREEWNWKRDHISDFIVYSTCALCVYVCVIARILIVGGGGEIELSSLSRIKS